MKWLWLTVFAIACSSSSSGGDAGLDAAPDEGADAAAACGAILVLGSACADGRTCAGPTIAKQCDGTTEQVSGDCSCKSGRWTCAGITVASCDAGASD